MTEESNEEKRLRSDAGASEGHEVATAVKQMFRLSSDQVIQEDAVRSGALPGDLQHFTKLFSQGMQWAKEHYPQQQGPKMVVFGNKNSSIDVAGVQHPVNEICLARPNNGRGIYFIIIPYEEINDFMTQHRKKELKVFKAQSRRSLGQLSGEEFIFLGGVEEYYHAVQDQDPVLKARYQAAEKPKSPFEPFTVTVGADVSQSKHDTELRELDIVPILQHALSEFRQRRTQLRDIGS